MQIENSQEKIKLTHHNKNELCTTRLPYRQGRKLTAVKVYSVNNESNHLLIFGVPSLNLRQEAKALFLKFGKLLQFNLMKEYPAEQFTETYHACYESTQSARIAKRMVDTKNFYGGSLHVCYAPELETVEETERKLLLRQQHVLSRLRNLEEDKHTINNTEAVQSTTEDKLHKRKLNMGAINTISIGKQMREVVFKKKRKIGPEKPVKMKTNIVNVDSNISKNPDSNLIANTDIHIVKEACITQNKSKETTEIRACEIVDCTSVDKETVSNIDEALNYNKFGNEIIKKLPPKPVNKIKFNFVNKT